MYKSRHEIGGSCMLWGTAHDARWAAFCSAWSTLGHAGLLPPSLPSPKGSPKLKNFIQV